MEVVSAICVALLILAVLKLRGDRTESRHRLLAHPEYLRGKQDGERERSSKRSYWNPDLGIRALGSEMGVRPSELDSLDGGRLTREYQRAYAKGYEEGVGN